MRDTLYEQLYQHAAMAILSVDRHGQVVDCNRHACQLLARGRDELVGTPLLTWIAAPERRPAKARFLRALEGRVVEWSTKVVRPRGSVRAVTVRAVPHGVPVAGGKVEVERIDALVWDAARVAQRAPAESLSQVLENMPGQFAVVLDADGVIRYCVGTGRTHWRNDADMLGSHLSTLMGFGAESRQQLHALRQHTAGGRTWTGQQVHQRADGAHVHVQLYAAPITDPGTGNVSGVVVVGRDISERIELRTRVQRAERLSHIGELTAGITHELQRPLAAVQAALPLCDCAGAGDALRLELQRMTELLERLHEFAADTVAEVARVELRGMVADVIRDELPRLRAARIRIGADIPATLPPVHADGVHVSRALRELVRNAADAVADEERREIRIDATCNAGMVSIRVRDTGAGVDAATAERAFAPFFTTRPGRFGLGLSIVRGIAAAHGGKARLETATSGGVAVLELPAHAATQGAPFRAVPLVLRSLSVLLVDDDAALRKMLRTVLERVGYTVTEAFSGRSALAALGAGKLPDLLVTDLKMSGGTGYWLIDKLKDEYPSLLARTVVLTGDPSPAHAEEITALTGCPVARKPLEFHVLLELMDEVALRALGRPRAAG